MKLYICVFHFYYRWHHLMRGTLFALLVDDLLPPYGKRYNENETRGLRHMRHTITNDTLPFLSGRFIGFGNIIHNIVCRRFVVSIFHSKLDPGGEGQNMTNNDILMLLAVENIRYYCLCESGDNCKGCINLTSFHFDEFLLLFVYSSSVRSDQYCDK